MKVTDTENIAAHLAMHYLPTRLELAVLDGWDTRIGLIICFPYRENPLNLDFNFHGRVSKQSMIRVIIFAIEQELQPGG